jgi:hypothetical protein
LKALAGGSVPKTKRELGLSERPNNFNRHGELKRALI